MVRRMFIATPLADDHELTALSQAVSARACRGEYEEIESRSHIQSFTRAQVERQVTCRRVVARVHQVALLPREFLEELAGYGVHAQDAFFGHAREVDARGWCATGELVDVRACEVRIWHHIDLLQVRLADRRLRRERRGNELHDRARIECSSELEELEPTRLHRCPPARCTTLCERKGAASVDRKRITGHGIRRRARA